MSSSVADDPAFAHLRIFAADDDDDDRLFLEEAFTELGLSDRVEVLPDGQALIERLVQSGEPFVVPPLCLLDLRMPRLGRAANARGTSAACEAD